MSYLACLAHSTGDKNKILIMFNLVNQAQPRGMFANLYHFAFGCPVNLNRVHYQCLACGFLNKCTSILLESRHRLFLRNRGQTKYGIDYNLFTIDLWADCKSHSLRERVDDLKNG